MPSNFSVTLGARSLSARIGLFRGRRHQQSRTPPRHRERPSAKATAWRGGSASGRGGSRETARRAAASGGGPSTRRGPPPGCILRAGPGRGCCAQLRNPFPLGNVPIQRRSHHAHVPLIVPLTCPRRSACAVPDLTGRLLDLWCPPSLTNVGQTWPAFARTDTICLPHLPQTRPTLA